MSYAELKEVSGSMIEETNLRRPQKTPRGVRGVRGR